MLRLMSGGHFTRDTPKPAAPEEVQRRVVIGRYVLHAPIARGGMATIYIARLTGAEGFTRIVAAKRLHPELLDDTEFVAMLLDEARIASRLRHPNVVPVVDAIMTGTEIVLVQEYVHGVPLSSLLRVARGMDRPVAASMLVTILSGVLAGLHAAHEAKDELGKSLCIVHRDVSPQNIMMTLDGTPKLLDFGIAKATLSAHVTRQGGYKGKLSYMAPEQLAGKATRATDLYSVGVMLWEGLVGDRLHQGASETETLVHIATADAPKLTAALGARRRDIPPARWAELVALEPIVARALEREPEARFATAAEMESALLAAVPRVAANAVGAWVAELGKDFLVGRNALLAHEEVSWRRQHGGIESGTRKVAQDVAHGDAHDHDIERPGPADVSSSVPRQHARIQPTEPAPSRPAGSRSPPPLPVPSLSSSSPSSSTKAITLSPPEPQTRYDSPAARSRDRRAQRLRLGLLFAVCCFVGVVVVRGRALVGAIASPGTSPRAQASASAAPVVAEPVAREPAVVGVPIVVLPSALAAPAVTAPAPALSAPAAPPPPAPAAPAPRRAWPRAAPAVDCNPPFYFEGGKKLYKPSCI